MQKIFMGGGCVPGHFESHPGKIILDSSKFLKYFDITESCGGSEMKSKLITFSSCVSFAVFAIFSSSALAESNPLLKQNNNVRTESSFEAMAIEIDKAATKKADDPICQNIRVNYEQELTKILSKTKNPENFSMSKIQTMSNDSDDTLDRMNRINRNITGSNSRGLNKASRNLDRSTAVANDVVEMGKMFGLGRKMSQKKAAKKVAKLDEQALDAVRQTGCPMATFN
ncbi:MAG: hypothetical protein AAGF15_03530 [Pseudomonadota bacterium]